MDTSHVTTVLRRCSLSSLEPRILISAERSVHLDTTVQMVWHHVLLVHSTTSSPYQDKENVSSVSLVKRPPPQVLPARMTASLLCVALANAQMEVNVFLFNTNQSVIVLLASLVSIVTLMWMNVPADHAIMVPPVLTKLRDTLVNVLRDSLASNVKLKNQIVWKEHALIEQCAKTFLDLATMSVSAEMDSRETTVT